MEFPCPAKVLIVLFILAPFVYLLVKYLTKEPEVPECGLREYLVKSNTTFGLPAAPPNGLLICK